ncbi:hypothetical protein PVA45_08290 (plasmid) [Entomospira entomophila]|uniref:Uncharacterized protein n=1 Tax=Entomospira entomophila TaxID=2719988 RepID=A0A968GDF4_9SPIO|nr:hypothetical protein [Entomospira entomophilus]NIZ41543.1 hypothetical protein [Entomospira entomophilus]WDI36429.1 hypothetical protein PVA45_08290 [Entomospira entomophilus]
MNNFSGIIRNRMPEYGQQGYLDAELFDELDENGFILKHEDAFILNGNLESITWVFQNDESVAWRISKDNQISVMSTIYSQQLRDIVSNYF